MMKYQGSRKPQGYATTWAAWVDVDGLRAVVHAAKNVYDPNNDDPVSFVVDDLRTELMDAKWIPPTDNECLVMRQNFVSHESRVKRRATDVLEFKAREAALEKLPHLPIIHYTPVI